LNFLVLQKSIRDVESPLDEKIADAKKKIARAARGEKLIDSQIDELTLETGLTKAQIQDLAAEQSQKVTCLVRTQNDRLRSF